MRESDEVRGIIEGAIESAFIDFPTAGNGTTWPPHYKLRPELRDTSNSSSGGP